MATPNASRVHRLLDMVVEEVSLVDRAANARRFLIVKRSEPMEQDIDSNERSEDRSEDRKVAANESRPSAESVDTPENSDPTPAIALATGALEALTEALETLRAASGEAAQEDIAELAHKLHAVATQWARGAGVESKTAATPSSDEARPDLDTVIASVRAALGRVEERLAVPPHGGDAEALDNTPASTRSEESTPEVTTKLDNLVSELRTLAQTVQDFQGRLARMEKRFGLPNSAPIGEHNKPRESMPDVGWPLDLNRSFDRESVDKAISFHDL